MVLQAGRRLVTKLLRADGPGELLSRLRGRYVTTEGFVITGGWISV